MSTKLVNIYHSKPYDIYIGRPSKWGNPFIIGKDGTREEVIKKYRDWVCEQPELIKSIINMELDDKILGCYCYPNKCHGDVLIELVDFIKKYK